MVEPGIIEPLAVGDQGAEDRADFQQLIPIAVVARQAGGIKAEDQANAGQANFREQPLEAAARSTSSYWKVSTLCMVRYLHERGLADVDTGHLRPLVGTRRE